MGRSKYTAISPKVKHAVGERDGWRCIICGAQGSPNAHVVNRSQGGMGIESNIVTLCHRCHAEMDNGKEGGILRDECKSYLRGIYAGWSEQKQKYDKWKGVFG